MIVELTDAAEADLEAIGDYIAQDNPAPAPSSVQELSRSWGSDAGRGRIVL
jgi:plasmid stabilization system protein ParE